MKKFFLVTLGLLSTLLLFGQFSAQEFSRTGNIPDLISFQGRLTDISGNPLNGSIDIIFSIYDTATGGVSLWVEDRSVLITDGLFQVNLGEEVPLTESYFEVDERWLALNVGEDPEMTPRIRIASAPYALNVLESDPTWSGDTDSTGDIGRTGSVGIGTATPGTKLHVNEGIFMTTGSFDSGPELPVSVTQTKMFFYPRKAAFRAGRVTGVHWDNNYIGAYSTAFGLNTSAYGYASTAMGFSSSASGNYSTAMGVATTASGDHSIAIGSYAVASGIFSTAMGYSSRASGDYSFAIHLSGTGAGPDVAANTFRISGAAQIGGNMAWTNYSDRKLKKEIESLQEEDNLAKILRLNGIRFRWNDYDKNLNLGFIAQDVEDIVPESVRYDEINDIYSMEYTALIPVLVEAIKEQQKQIEELLQRIIILENR